MYRESQELRCEYNFDIGTTHRVPPLELPFNSEDICRPYNEAAPAVKPFRCSQAGSYVGVASLCGFEFTQRSPSIGAVGGNLENDSYPELDLSRIAAALYGRGSTRCR
jgi:hypothetical protein